MVSVDLVFSKQSDNILISTKLHHGLTPDHTAILCKLDVYVPVQRPETFSYQYLKKINTGALNTISFTLSHKPVLSVTTINISVLSLTSTPLSAVAQSVQGSHINEPTSIDQYQSTRVSQTTTVDPHQSTFINQPTSIYFHQSTHINLLSPIDPHQSAHISQPTSVDPHQSTHNQPTSANPPQSTHINQPASVNPHQSFHICRFYMPRCSLAVSISLFRGPLSWLGLSQHTDTSNTDTSKNTKAWTVTTH